MHSLILAKNKNNKSIGLPGQEDKPPQLINRWFFTLVLKNEGEGLYLAESTREAVNLV